MIPIRLQMIMPFLQSIGSVEQVDDGQSHIMWPTYEVYISAAVIIS